MQEQRFFAAAIEHERIAPLQPRDNAAFARLLGEQVADGLLRHGLRRGRADVDPFCVLRRVLQQARVDEMVVEHHFGDGQAGQSAHADETGVAGPGADEVDDGTRHGGIISAKWVHKC